MTDEASPQLDQLIVTLSKELEFTTIEIADILWLALQFPGDGEKASVVHSDSKPKSRKQPSNSAASSQTSSNTEKRAEIDEQATAKLTAENRICIPVLKPALEPWFDLALVVDESKSMIFWRKTIQELQQLLEHCGAFRDVRTWGLVTNEKGKVVLQRGTGKKVRHRRLYDPRELIDPTGQRLILVLSDCVGAIWRNGLAISVLNMWVKQNPVAIVQMLPEWLWLRTGLSLGAMVQLGSSTPRVANQSLLIKNVLLWDDINFVTGIKVPVFTLEPEVAKTWSEMVAGKSYAKATGFVFPSEFYPIEDEDSEPESADSEELVNSFRLTASPMARKLASLLSAAPVITLPIVRVIQQTMLRESQQVHVAEVFLGGIIKPLGNITSETNPNNIEFVFIDEQRSDDRTIRDIFLQAAPETHSVEVINAISEHFAKRLGKTLIEFYALLRKPEVAQIDGVSTKTFALVTAKVLKRLGGDYLRFAEELEEQWKQIDEGEISGEKVLLQTFTFDVATVDVKKSKGRQEPQITITRTRHEAQYFTENLGNGVTLEMVAIPGDTFRMGAPETEEESTDDERPQHEVTVPPFYMGKYTVTQAQWRVVANLPQVNRELEPDPSYFKGENLPVERVSWYDAEEFCARLSVHTKRHYRLPSEAEWEYACRSGTTTPFQFGETITPELANYNGNYTYGSGAKGEYLEKTTPVGSFEIANNFGLFDMHGNVWEWCQDYWHENYESAPSDGIAWDDLSSDNQIRLLRGGSWVNSAMNCRSASRNHDVAGLRSNRICFRVVLSVART